MIQETLQLALSISVLSNVASMYGLYKYSQFIERDLSDLKKQILEIMIKDALKNMPKLNGGKKNV